MSDEKTQSIWTATTPQTHYPTLDRDLAVDVAIVGGGIAGLTAAVLLKKAGRTVAVLEKSRIVTGETGHTTAHITEILDSPYSQLSSDFGEDGATLAAESIRASINQIAELVREFSLDCDYVKVPGYIYIESERELGSLERELRAMRKVGLSCELVNDVPLPFRAPAAIRLNDQAQFHPRKYLLPLAEWVNADGSFVFENTPCDEFQDGSPCRIHTPHGTVTALDVIVAAYSPICNWAFLHSKIPPYRTYAIGAKLKSGKAVPGLFWDTADPYHYIRSQPDGENGEILIVGGEDHRTGTKEDTEECFKRLEEYTQARFDVESFPYRWSGQILEPVDGLAYIGKNSMSEHIYVATGFSGTGMTWGTLSGMILSDLIVKGKNKWASLYDATRINALASASDYISENIEFPKHLVTDRFAPAAESLDEVHPGEGKLVKVEGDKVAVYRDLHGELHGCSPVCTHMGCYVHFNNAEKTWDCPCHGSRFNVDGEVVNGPAVTNLKKVELPVEHRA
ncbi:MAG TPA: FAD-dependent oxidoreductase [Planctomycetota bacterium]|nr:FAD-dependent oxidoreductase [Planctomycetota bacterium]